MSKHRLSKESAFSVSLMQRRFFKHILALCGFFAQLNPHAKKLTFSNRQRRYKHGREKGAAAYSLACALEFQYSTHSLIAAESNKTGVCMHRQHYIRATRKGAAQQTYLTQGTSLTETLHTQSIFVYLSIYPGIKRIYSFLFHITSYFHVQKSALM